MLIILNLLEVCTNVYESVGETFEYLAGQLGFEPRIQGFGVLHVTVTLPT